MEKLPDYSDKRFLIVDDEPFMVYLIDRMLRECGVVHILKAADGAAALKIIGGASNQVDCVISDCNMAPVNGLEFLQSIRLGRSAHIPREQPFIMLTGQGDTDVVQTAIRLDVNGYLVKPVAPEKLARSLLRVFSRTLHVKDAAHYGAITLAKIHTLDGQRSFGGIDPQISSVPALHDRSNHDALDPYLDAAAKPLKSPHSSNGEEQVISFGGRRRCRLFELAEGMIVAEDIFATDGPLLVRLGTCLTDGMAKRLRILEIETESRGCVWIGAEQLPRC